ncbi:MAG TPA: tetratricopeptide repeat protein [Gemmatimonas sp.]|uniref:tetratricopeptide repeat protein n=1 Tax=Gemmatimonas sp. TaxID=1962908 RepID=UPI002ED89CDE
MTTMVHAGAATSADTAVDTEAAGRPSVDRGVGLLRAMLDRVDQQDPGAFNNLGVLYHARGLHADAVEAFLRALALDPRMRTAARNLEVAAALPGACDERLARIQARIEADPDDREALREQAHLTRVIGRTSEATRQLDALIAEDPDDGEALFERGLIEQRAGDLRRAQRWFERAVNAGAVSDARLHLAEVLYQRGQNEQSLDVLDQLLAESPRHADAHLLRGFLLGDMGHHEQALQATRRAAELNPALETVQSDLSIDTGTSPLGHATAMMAVEPDGALARYGLGLAFRQRGYFREARAEFDRAISQGEDVRLVQHALAELDLIDGNSADARARYEQLLTEQETARWWNEHGVALHQSGDVTAAADSYRRALRIDPRDALAYNNLGVALADRGDANAAREALTRAAELDPTFVRARRNLACLLAWNGEGLAALSLLRELVAFHPRDADAWYATGQVLASLDRPEDARDAFVKAIEQRPSHAEARFALADVLDRLGDQDGAVRETEQALAISPVRADARLTVGIELQRECPDAVGRVDLLRLTGGAPLTGVSVNELEVSGLLPEQPAQVVALSAHERAVAECAAADAFAERTLHGEAVERYQRARELVQEQRSDASTVAPDLVATWHRATVGAARSRCLLHRAASARPLLDELITRTPDDHEVLALMAASLTDSAAGDPGESDQQAARAVLLRLLAQDVTSPALLHFAGDVSTQLADRSLALGFYRRALARDPMRPTPRVAIARLLREQGDLLAARLEIVAALAAAPRWREARIELARLHRDAGRLDEARVELAECLELVPTDLDALELLAGVLVAEERTDDARVAVDRLLRHDPSRSAALWYDGVLLARQARVRDALSRWTRVANDPDAGIWGERASSALTQARGFLQADPAQVA